MKIICAKKSAKANPRNDMIADIMIGFDFVSDNVLDIGAYVFGCDWNWDEIEGPCEPPIVGGIDAACNLLLNFGVMMALCTVQILDLLIEEVNPSTEIETYKRSKMQYKLKYWGVMITIS